MGVVDRRVFEIKCFIDYFILCREYVVILKISFDEYVSVDFIRI